MNNDANYLKVVIQEADFNLQQELENLRQGNKSIGALVNFVGVVRDDPGENNTFKGLFLEHYPGMTEGVIEGLITKAEEKWSLEAVKVIHRVGALALGDQIVLVAVASKHRGEAFAAAEFIMDFLKTDAPIWKKQLNDDGDFWVEAKQKDQDKRDKY